MDRFKTWRSKGLTLLEMLLVSLIVALLVSIIYLVLSSVLESMRQARCMNHLYQIGVAIKMFQEDHGRLPGWLFDLYPHYINSLDTFICPSDPKPWPVNPAKGEFVSYIYHNWGDTPPPKEAEIKDWIPWSKALQMRGDQFPIAVCPHHPNCFIVLRLNGSIEKVTKKLQLGFSSWKL